MLRKRIVFLRQLRELAPIYGFETIVYLDESRFEAASCRQAIGERIGHKVSRLVEPLGARTSISCSALPIGHHSRYRCLP
jgi:hypothetical protein